MTKINGIKIEKLLNLRAAVKKNLGNNKKTWPAKTKWLGGTASVTKVRDFEVRVDDPEERGGSNTAPNPAETLLAALGSCIIIDYVCTAALEGINIEELEVDIKGETDPEGFFGLSDKKGFQRITCSVSLRSDAGKAKLEKLHKHVVETSPIGNTIQRKVPVSFELDIK